MYLYYLYYLYCVPVYILRQEAYSCTASSTRPGIYSFSTNVYYVSVLSVLWYYVYYVLCTYLHRVEGSQVVQHPPLGKGLLPLAQMCTKYLCYLYYLYYLYCVSVYILWQEAQLYSILNKARDISL